MAMGGRVPKGMMTLFAGDPKLGKSFVTLYMAPPFRAGALPMSDRPNRPGSAILMTAEDDPTGRSCRGSTRRAPI